MFQLLFTKECVFISSLSSPKITQRSHRRSKFATKSITPTFLANIYVSIFSPCQKKRKTRLTVGGLLRTQSPLFSCNCSASCSIFQVPFKTHPQVKLINQIYNLHLRCFFAKFTNSSSEDIQTLRSVDFQKLSFLQFLSC